MDVCFWGVLITAEMCLEVCNQQTELTLGLLTHTHVHAAVLRTNTGTNKKHIKPVWVVASLTTCANQSVENNLSGNL